MKELIVRAPINSLSFGNVSYNLLRELYRKGINVSLFPIGDSMNLEAYDKIEEDFKAWIISSAQNRFNLVDKNIPTLTQWHLNGAEYRVSARQYLYTFYEVDQPTLTEKKSRRSTGQGSFLAAPTQKRSSISWGVKMWPQFHVDLTKTFILRAKHI